MCLKMIRRSDAPAILAASTNSRSRRVKNSVRTNRASPIQAKRPSIIARGTTPKFPNLKPITAPITMVGVTKNISVSLIRTESTNPPKNPAIAPMIVPITIPKVPTINITMIDC